MSVIPREIRCSYGPMQNLVMFRLCIKACSVLIFVVFLKGSNCG
uniref:Uncharacterized protein n=1 Tax=Arundo donax TaxID=35708 RepID=A0A0A9FME6_ARUDO